MRPSTTLARARRRPCWATSITRARKQSASARPIAKENSTGEHRQQVAAVDLVVPVPEHRDHGEPGDGAGYGCTRRGRHRAGPTTEEPAGERNRGRPEQRDELVRHCLIDHQADERDEPHGGGEVEAQTGNPANQSSDHPVSCAEEVARGAGTTASTHDRRCRRLWGWNH